MPGRSRGFTPRTSRRSTDARSGSPTPAQCEFHAGPLDDGQDSAEVREGRAVHGSGKGTGQCNDSATNGGTNQPTYGVARLAVVGGAHAHRDWRGIRPECGRSHIRSCQKRQRDQGRGSLVRDDRDNVGQCPRPAVRDAGGVPGDLHVRPSVVIPEGELRWRFSRSSGPGGQSVNTTDSRVELSWDLAASPVLSPTLRERAAAAPVGSARRRCADRGRLRAPVAAAQPFGRRGQAERPGRRRDRSTRPQAPTDAAVEGVERAAHRGEEAPRRHQATPPPGGIGRWANRRSRHEAIVSSTRRSSAADQPAVRGDVSAAVRRVGPPAVRGDCLDV